MPIKKKVYEDQLCGVLNDRFNSFTFFPMSIALTILLKPIVQLM